MNEDQFNLSLRKFLKEVGVTSQRVIENAVRDAVKSERLAGNEMLRARMTLEVEGIAIRHVVEVRSRSADIWVPTCHPSCSPRTAPPRKRKLPLPP
jgi:Family of unknown function (DUF6494)